MESVMDPFNLHYGDRSALAGWDWGSEWSGSICTLCAIFCRLQGMGGVDRRREGCGMVTGWRDARFPDSIF